MGKDFVEIFKETFKDEFDKRILHPPMRDPTRRWTLKSSGFGAEALFIAGTPKFTAQAMRKAHEIDWKPLIVVNFISRSVSATLVPAGLENAVGAISGSFYKDPND